MSNKIPKDMAKIQIKSEIRTCFGEKIYFLENINTHFVALLI